MDVSALLDPLNPAQREAVSTHAQHTLILAGAGSGKTRVLVHRIAWLLQTQQARPHNILAVTFTNKAAQEMRTRIEKLLQYQALGGLWVGTFHSIANRLLRMHHEQAKLPANFQVLDSDDQQRLLKQVIKSLNLDEKIWMPQQSQHFISARKENMERPTHIHIAANDTWTATLVKIYQQYDLICQKNGVVDFSELLLRCYEMLHNDPDLLQQYQQRFRFILVDEFQDTNTIQYQWLNLLAGKKGHLFVVGDDDQSIYGWRGAKIEHIQHFPTQFENTHIVRLEQNYRSTGMILAAANALIANNTQRLGKELWTEGKQGDAVQIYTAFSEIDEAAFVVERIRQWNGKRNQIAILYRTAAQSRLFEEALLQRSIPYRIYGGIRFYERAEVKNALAYLRVLYYPNDDTAFERIINIPKRGIGDTTVEKLRAIAREQGLSLWNAALHVTQSASTKRTTGALYEFLHLMVHLQQMIQEMPLAQKMDCILKNTGLWAFYQKEGKEDNEKRLENLEELINAARQFAVNNTESTDILNDFLAHAALESGEGQGSRDEDCVQLMTLHLAKGLEFQLVFLCGLEEGLFPHKNSLDEGKIEEERRLCYVGITRAREKLYLSHSETRYQYGLRDFSRPSRFIKEIPPELTDTVRLRTSPAIPSTPSIAGRKTQAIGFKMGERVTHRNFGEGIVVNAEGQGEFARIQVRFATEGTKWLVVAYAGLEKLDE